MPTPRDPAMLLAAARMYYVQGRSQAQVADALGTSRSNVSRMLTEAQNQGIVEIRINDPEGRVHDLEDELRDRFGLRDVRVAHAGLVAGLRIEDQVGTQAARLLLDNLKDAMTVALSWGQALQAMVYATTAQTEHHRLSLVQLVGGLSSISNEISGQELVRELAVRLGAEYRFLHAPATLETRRSRDALLGESSISDALTEAARADLALVGIGTPTHGSSSAILESLNLAPAELDAFWAAGPVGDVAARYYDAEGRPIQGAVDDRVLGVDLPTLLEIPHVVGVTWGRAKIPGVLGALRGHLIDSLVCDETLARGLISAARTRPDSTGGA
ncbi:sugar-binding transcriptional regulator [Nocardioides kribbensis]|uniref:sugar-binding transcriptional regulator n=1 Tax=Nocardioides kribbensis TaxID=305517 RepID=UPI001879D6BE|nr:sugar-binding domain-containing protein [Nocardioides kribbensis]